MNINKNVIFKMKENSFKYPSIFNDVLGPVTQGPSSSNTVGPYRIGKLTRDMIKGRIQTVEFEMSERGGFRETFYSMDSDKGLLCGLLELDIVSDNLVKAYEIAEKMGLKYEFTFSERIDTDFSEKGELKITTILDSGKEEKLVLTAVSLGGGEIFIPVVNGEEVNLSGRYEMSFTPKGLEGERVLHSVYPFDLKKDACPPFATSKEMVEYAKLPENKDRSFFELAIDYEVSVADFTREEVWQRAEKMLDIQYLAIEKGYEKEIKFDGVTVAKAKTIKDTLADIRLIPNGISDISGLDALSLMEYSNSHGIICCMPTGGATGIIPAAIKGASKSLGLSKKEEVQALIVSGLLGVFYYPTHYSGSLGCQAEVGIATSMASGALCSMLSNDVGKIEKAAVLAMQCLLGQVCDPILGYVQIPCFIRNVASVSLATTCANYAILGLDTGIDIDEMAKAVVRVGEGLRSIRLNDKGCCACKHNLDTVECN